MYLFLLFLLSSGILGGSREHNHKENLCVLRVCGEDNLIADSRSRTIQSHEGATVFMAQCAHEGGKPFSGVAASDHIS